MLSSGQSEQLGDSKARSYSRSILGFDIIVSLVVVEFVLQGVMPLNELLQTQSINLVQAARESQVLIATFRAERADDAVCDELYGKVVAMAEVQEVELYYPFVDHLVVELED